ncbi:MAG: hypothetical protein HFH63_06770 [Lachnospiraceae bacterium]|nr:hypothetical protein [Lachnospiraceae bacterium]
MRKVLGISEYCVSAQDRIYRLFDEPNKKFLIKSDLAVRDKIRGTIYIMDTKWKVLSDAKPNYGISQADMYQMYAYQKKYSAENVTLIFPFTEKISANKIIEFHSQDNVTVKVKFVDLFDIRKSLENIISEFGI